MRSPKNPSFSAASRETRYRFAPWPLICVLTACGGASDEDETDTNVPGGMTTGTGGDGVTPSVEGTQEGGGPQGGAAAIGGSSDPTTGSASSVGGTPGGGASAGGSSSGGVGGDSSGGAANTGGVGGENVGGGSQSGGASTGGAPSGDPCADLAPPWNSFSNYPGGSKVTRDGKLYTANYWNTGVDPSGAHSGQWSSGVDCSSVPPRPPVFQACVEACQKDVWAGCAGRLAGDFPESVGVGYSSIEANACVSFCRADAIFWEDVGCNAEWLDLMSCYTAISSADDIVCSGGAFPDLSQGICRTELDLLQDCAATGVLDQTKPAPQKPGLTCTSVVRHAGRTGCTVSFQGSTFTYYLPESDIVGLHVITGSQVNPSTFDPSWSDSEGLVDVYPTKVDGTFAPAYTFAVVRELQSKLSIPTSTPVRYRCGGQAHCSALLNGYHPEYLTQAPGPIFTIWFVNATPSPASLGTPIQYPIHFLYSELSTEQGWSQVASISVDDRTTEHGCSGVMLANPYMWEGAERDLRELEKTYCNNVGPYRFGANRVF